MDTKSVSKEGRSVFHTPLPPVDLSKEGTEISEAWHQYLDAWVKMGGAGTHLADKLSQTFTRVGCQDAGVSEISRDLCEIAGQFHALTAAVANCITKETGLVKNEVTAALLQLSLPKECNGTTDETGSNQEKVLLCLLLKAVQLLHKITQTSVVALEPLGVFCDRHGAYCQHNAAGHCQNTTNDMVKGDRTEKGDADVNSQVQSPSVLRRQINKATNFLTKLGGKPAMGDTQSAFYVDLPVQMNGHHSEPHSPALTGQSVQNQSQCVISNTALQSPSTQQSQSEGAPGAKPKESSHNLGQHTPPGVKQNGHIASQEEIDNVIALLSGPRAPMQSIPEHSTDMGTPNQRLAPGYNPQQKATTLQPGSRMHRKSEGAIGESYASILNKNKTNTWPHKPRVRNSLPAETISMQLHSMFDGLQIESDYAKYIQSVQQMQQGQYGDGSHGNQSQLFPDGSMWAAAGPPVGHTGGWSGQPFPTNGPELVNHKWSTGQDSSSCSSDSSNGETPWSMGLDLSSTYTNKRRHSSSEDTLVGSVGYNTLEDVITVPIDKEAKTRTWPMKPTGKPANPEGERWTHEAVSTNHLNVHPPLQMQWSDPLASRSLSPWGSSALSPALSYHGISAPPGGPETNQMLPPPAVTK